MNRRKKITREDGTRWNYGYNDKGEVTSGIREKTAAPNTAIPGWSHGYSFDEIGNRLATTTNGRASTYTANKLNQITSRTIPRAFDIIGKAATTAAVTVNSQATTRLDEFFYKELPAGSGAVHVPYNVAATDATGTPTMRNGGKFLPATPEISIYDFDGNLTSDGRFTYTWDAENRLIAMQTLATVPVIAQRKLAFAYDAMGRRIRKTTWNGTATGTWQPQLDLRFIHELGGWNILAEITADSKFLRTYTWGPDLSGNQSGAGGVGGLLFSNFRASGKTFAHGMDLNGNVTLLVNTATGRAAATYDYGPFGEPLRQSGEYAKTNPYRFSTKYTDDETGLLDYGHRYYDPMTGRWPSRDPIEEEGGVNLYGFVVNNGVCHWDHLGQSINLYEVDTNSIPLEVGQVSGTSLAETDVRNWQYSGVTSLTSAAYFGIGSNEELELKGRLEISIKKRAGIDDNYLKVGNNNSGFTLAQHERHHAWLCKKAFNEAAKKANSYEGKYCGGCSDKAKRYALAIMGLALEEQHLENKTFDNFDYGGGNVSEIDSARYTNSKKELNDAKNEFDTSKCAKL